MFKFTFKQQGFWIIKIIGLWSHSDWYWPPLILQRCNFFQNFFIPVSLTVPMTLKTMVCLVTESPKVSSVSNVPPSADSLSSSHCGDDSDLVSESLLGLEGESSHAHFHKTNTSFSLTVRSLIPIPSLNSFYCRKSGHTVIIFWREGGRERGREGGGGGEREREREREGWGGIERDT